MLARLLAPRVAWGLALIVTVVGASATPWDVQWARTGDLDVVVSSETVEEVDGITLRLREFSYLSHVWEGEEIRIAGHLAAPASDRALPAMVLVTDGMGGAKRMAAGNNVVALAIDRVGAGGSTGPTDTYDNWLDLDEGTDIHNSWMHHYVMSAMRAITYLAGLEEVRADAIGVSGTSRGGICTLLTSAADDRVALSVPIAGTGDMVRTEAFPDNWIASIFLAQGGKSNDSAAFHRFTHHYDPERYVHEFHGFVWIINGTQDEFFPITSTVALTRGAGDRLRLEAVYDADHGHYGNDAGLFDTYLNTGIGPRLAGCLSKAIRSVLHENQAPPATPSLSVFVEGVTLTGVAEIDGGDEIAAVQLIHSTDDAYTFSRAPMSEDEADPGSWRAMTDMTPGSSLAVFVEVEYRDAVGGYFLTSVPELSEGFVPRIRPFASQ
jgi:dienelactone hydrolase